MKGREASAFIILAVVGMCALTIFAFGLAMGVVVFFALAVTLLVSLHYISDKSNACGPDM